MNKITARNALERMKNRYWRPVIARQDGVLGHFGDCDVYRSVEVYGTAPCTCGFNYDLGTADIFMDGFLANKINPEYRKQMAQQDGLPTEPLTDKQIQEIEAAFAKAGIKVNVPRTQEEIEEDAAGDISAWELIAEVFGQDYVNYLQEKQNATATG